jgi:hypothetical protein
MLVCGLAAAPFALAASVVAAIQKRGATFHVVARKPARNDPRQSSPRR